MPEDSLSGFRLVGGTALALQLGHRKSVDLDLFTDHSFDQNLVIESLKQMFNFQIDFRRPQGFQLSIGEIKVDLYNWAVPWLDAAVRNAKNAMMALSSVDAADPDAMPDMIIPVSWEKVKSRLKVEVEEYEAQIILTRRQEQAEQDKKIEDLIEKKRQRKM